MWIARLSVMLPLYTIVLILACFTQQSVSITSIDGAVEGLFKKYGMMKIFEDCYGKDTVQAWWVEMTEATQKCRNMPHNSDRDDEEEDNQIVNNKVQQADDTRRKITQTAKKPQPIDFGGMKGIYPSFLREAPVYPPLQAQRIRIQDPYRGRPLAMPVQHPFYYVAPDQGNFFYSVLAGADGSSRHARAMDASTVRQLVQSKINSKIGNITCILRELNFLDVENQPNMDGIYSRIMSLSIPDDIKKDMVEGVNMCSDFSKCVPLTKYDKLPALKSLARPYMFFNCYKTQKLMACMKKDFREQYGVTIDESSFTQRSGFSSIVDQSDEEAEVSMFSMIFGFSDQEKA